MSELSLDFKGLAAKEIERQLAERGNIPARREKNLTNWWILAVTILLLLNISQLIYIIVSFTHGDAGMTEKDCRLDAQPRFNSTTEQDEIEILSDLNTTTKLFEPYTVSDSTIDINVTSQSFFPFANESTVAEDTRESSTQPTPEANFPLNCLTLKNLGDKSGMRTIFPHGPKSTVKMEVYCDQDTDGGGWTVIQRRDTFPIRENFNRNWEDYVQGFGNLTEEFWLGLENIHLLTTASLTTLRIDLQDWDAGSSYAKYDVFVVGNLNSKYQLIIGFYSGDAGDSFSDHPLSGMQFSTFDKDHDMSLSRNCAKDFKGGWWFNSCMYVNLNGAPSERTEDNSFGIIYYTWKSSTHSMKRTTMMLRPYGA